ncbi:2-succinylbenzoate--CoA ligase [Alicyclobacillus contaminans]|uniref:o-succinylbenzoate--CoA ligase n=1 Tax=Alicyclobacillus contaminans TaxID=392016 RepID=UPI0004264C46|nr:o-succinylbenzoate--CoA ligase [Alicyclobacillus contaminans]GMA52267.1 2-succinylbenzoate--CoA ligase [Alicyclobacillus contaminans]
MEANPILPILPDWLSKRAADHPNVVAIEAPDGAFTYSELLQVARRLAGVLRESGVQPGEPVALLCRRGLWFTVGLHGVMQADAIAVPLNLRLTPSELAWQLRDAGARVVIHDEDSASLTHAVERELGFHVTAVALPQAVVDGTAGSQAGRAHIALEQPLAIMYTSGTTGHPKGAVITHGNQWWSAMNSALLFGVHRGDRWLAPMPLFHMGGLSVLMRSLIYGTTAVVHNGFDAAAVNAALDRGSIHLLSVVPVMLQRMLADRQRPYPASLRAVLLGGSAATRALLERCQALRVPVSQSYGLTEANSQVTTLRAEDGLRKLGSSGKPLTVTEVAVWVEGRPVEANQVGEIVLRGPTVIPGYWNRPEATAAAFRDGWFQTGDIGYLDEEGYLYVLDRRTDLIVSGGENVYPAEIESVLSTHPAVLDVGVTGQPHPEWGHVPVAFVHAAGEDIHLAEALERHCRERLAGYKVPKAFYFVDALPRNASGKLMRRKLREWLDSK